MFKVVIPMYGLQREITELREVEVELREGATMPEVIAAMRAKVPSLEGPVVRLQPANPTMGPIYVDKDKVEIQGKVLAVLRRVDIFSAGRRQVLRFLQARTEGDQDA